MEECRTVNSDVAGSMPATSANNAKDILVVGYPRCGERFLSYNYGQLTGTMAEISHDINTINNYDGPVVCIVRYPVDSLASSLAMGLYVNNVSYNELNKNAIQSSIKTYIEFCSNILNKDNVVFVSFEDVIKNTVSVIKYLSYTFDNKYKYKKLTTQEEIFKLSPKESGYISTSKNLPNYKTIYEDFKSEDLSNVHDLYNKLIDRCIIVDEYEWIDWTGSHG